MHFTAFALLALTTNASAFPSLFSPRQANVLHERTDYHLFNIPTASFLASRDAETDVAMGIDWTADGCSSSPDDPFGFDFRNSCLRHDFGYRNYKVQRRCGAAAKKRIDQNFRKHMFEYCKTVENEDKRDACEGVAKVDYESARVFARSSFC